MSQNTYGKKFLKQAGRKGMMKWGAGKPVIRKEKINLQEQIESAIEEPDDEETQPDRDDD
jgi:hypothetical protein